MDPKTGIIFNDEQGKWDVGRGLWLDRRRRRQKKAISVVVGTLIESHSTHR